MANALYPKFKEALLKADVDLEGGTVKAVLVDTGTYTYNAAHDFFDDVSGVVGTAATLASKTFTNGTFDAADTAFAAIASGNSIEAIIIYVDSGSAATSPVVCYLDTGITGLPRTPSNDTFTIQWNASGIFSL
jgi:predicted dehydrogenase